LAILLKENPLKKSKPKDLFEKIVKIDRRFCRFCCVIRFEEERMIQEEQNKNNNE
jgi:hypothetical protein